MNEIKTDLEAALRSHAAASRRDLDEHPSIEELSAYLGAELTFADSERLRDHLTVCHMCTDLFLDLAAFPRLEPAAGHEPVSVREVEAAWREMGPELLSATANEVRSTSPEEAAEKAAGPAAAPGWLDEIRAGLWSLFESARFAYGLAAMLLLALPLTRYWTLSQESRPEQIQPDFNVAIYSLDSQRSRPVPHEITIPADAKQVLLVLNVLAEPSDADFVVEMFDLPAKGPPRWRGDGLQPGDVGNFVVALPRELLPAGQYLIRVSGRDGEATKVVVEYEVRVDDGVQAESR